MPEIESTLSCTGCGRRIASDERQPFRCPDGRPGDDIDHVLRRRLEVDASARERLGRRFLSDESNPFLRYRELLHSYRTALAWGMTDAAFSELVRELDAQVSAVAGTGFRETPFRAHPALAHALGCAELWVKDETGNVGGTHKGRHLAGLMLWLLMEERLRDGSAAERPRLAISSCGNAAWAATLLARGVDWLIDVYVPSDVDGFVVDRLSSDGVGLTQCERRPGEAGDPAYLRFSEALEAGSVPFTCQGPSNGLVIEGGQTLVWEIISSLLRTGSELDRLLVQTGGGALAAACVLGWREARQVCDIGPMPALHTVQTQGAAPLARAYDALAARLASRHLGIEGDRSDARTERADLAALIQAEIDPEAIRDELHYAASHRSEFMWPWEEEPRSIADAILDDETYDWLSLLSGMFESGGYPIVVSEEQLLEANEMAHRMTDVNVSDTGSAGLAGVLELADAGLLAETDRVGLLFSGVRWRRSRD